MCIYNSLNVDKENLMFDMKKILLLAIGSTVRLLSYWDYHKECENLVKSCGLDMTSAYKDLFVLLC